MAVVLEGSAFFEALRLDLENGGHGWIETTEDMYHDQLGAVPPLAIGNNCFMGGEPYTHNSAGEAISICFHIRPIREVERIKVRTSCGDLIEYVSKYMTLNEFRRQMGSRMRQQEAFSF
jgi:hypothetical protein